MATLPANSLTVYSLCLKEITAPNGEKVNLLNYLHSSCTDKFAITKAPNYLLANYNVLIFTFTFSQVLIISTQFCMVHIT